MKSKKLKYYFKYILRPTKTIKLSLMYLYARFILFLALKGINLPGLKKIKNKLPQNARVIFDRKVLIYEIKGARFSFRKGPIWFRKFYEKLIFIVDTNKFWFLIVFKTTIASVLILIPILSFILIRGMLPVPERVPYSKITTELKKSSSVRTDWPYTEAPFYKSKSNSNFNINKMNSKMSRGVVLTPVLEPMAPQGLTHFGIGYYPNKLNLIRGFLVSENSALSIYSHPIKVEQNSENRLRIQTYLFPSLNSNTYQCKIELKDENNHILSSSVETTPDKDSLDSDSGLYKPWHELFTPDNLPGTSKVNELLIPSMNVPKIIYASVKQMSDNSLEVKGPLKKYSSHVHDLTEDNCVFALGDLSYESHVIKPLKRRGIIFILVDTLRADTAFDSNLMPNLNEFAKTSGVRFYEHRAQGNMTVPSLTSLMTSHYARELGSVAFTYAADSHMKKTFYATKTPLLPTTLQNLGYRVGGIGWLSLFTEAMEGGVDFGFHNAIVSENSAYEARQITEQAGTWLENYGDAPFFLYLHYNTMHGPYKPPFSEINFSKFLSKPFGLNQRKQLYDALGRYWDDEFLNLIQKLKDLNIYDDVDIIITADHGAQFYNQPWDNLSGVNNGVSGGYADKGHTLLDEEVRVPLIIHLSDFTKNNGSIVSEPTAHVDLFPTIYQLAGGEKPKKEWRGLSLFPALVNENISFHSLLQKRDFIYFDAHRYAGILYWGKEFKNSPVKYIRQFDPDDVTLYLTHNPWNMKIHWYQPEIFTNVNFQDHTENWVSNLQGLKLKQMRQTYISRTPSDKILRMTPKYSGTFESKLVLKNSFNQSIKEPLIDLIPDKVKVTKIKEDKKTIFIFKGNVKPGDSIWVNLGSYLIDKITFENGITTLLCQNGNSVLSQSLAKLFENQVCPFFPPPDGIIDENYTNLDKPVIIQKSLSSEQVEQLEGTGAGEALQNALREWGYAK